MFLCEVHFPDERESLNPNQTKNERSRIDRNIALVTSRYFARVDYSREILASRNLYFFFFVLSFQTKRNETV